jgi:hypothetical protein
MVVPLAMEGGEICTGQLILQPISLKPDRLPGAGLTGRVGADAKRTLNPAIHVS